MRSLGAYGTYPLLGDLKAEQPVPPLVFSRPENNQELPLDFDILVTEILAFDRHSNKSTADFTETMTLHLSLIQEMCHNATVSGVQHQKSHQISYVK